MASGNAPKRPGRRDQTPPATRSSRPPSGSEPNPATELETTRQELREATERERAIGEILEAISRSPADLQPVLDTIADRARRLCDAQDAVVVGIDGDRLPTLAHLGPIPTGPSRPLEHSHFTGRAVLTRQTVHVLDAQADSYEVARAAAKALGYHTVLVTPLLRSGEAIGALYIRRAEARPFTLSQIALLKTFAGQAVIAIENVRLFNETREALERQTATSELLAAMSESAFDLQPVFDMVLDKSLALCDAEYGWVHQFDENDETFRQIAGRMSSAMAPIGEREERWRAPEASLIGRVSRERRTLHIVDIMADPTVAESDRLISNGARTAVGVPLLRGDRLLGGIIIVRVEVRPFEPRQIELVESFARQAAIAIENVRLFNETKEALERQTAVGEILRAIAGSPTDVQPVLQAITASAIRFCAAEDAIVMLPEGPALHLAAHSGPVPAAADLAYPLDGTSMNARAFVEGRMLHTTDLQAEADRYPAGAAHARAFGYRAALVAPLLREGSAIGTIALRRFDARPFTDRHVDLLRTFADQAIIAIENVRLFNETKEALERQTATGEVLKVISRSAFDLKRVLDTVIESATKLTNGSTGAIWELEGDEYHYVAAANPNDLMQKALRQRTAVRLDENESVLARAARSGRPVQVEDVQTDPSYRSSPRDNVYGHTRLGVPLLREGVPIGVLVIGREEVRLFTDKEIELVVSFADQAVIAIENTRLLNEIQDKSRQLEAASRHKSEFMANMSHELRTPLNAIIGFSDVLEQRLFGELNERQSDYTRDIASSGRHLLDLVNEILDLSKIEAGRMELEPSEFALADTIQGALAFVRERAASHRIGLTADVPPDLGTLVADERKVRQVLLNLLSNAVKFTPDGGTIVVRARRDGAEVQVSVRDTGIGIAPEDQAKVFDEFQQVGKASDRSREGTGLGLTLAKRFVELHGGRIWIESEVGKGTTFTFAVPVGRAVAAPA